MCPVANQIYFWNSAFPFKHQNFFMGERVRSFIAEVQFQSSSAHPTALELLNIFKRIVRSRIGSLGALAIKCLNLNLLSSCLNQQSHPTNQADRPKGPNYYATSIPSTLTLNPTHYAIPTIVLIFCYFFVRVVKVWETHFLVDGKTVAAGSLSVVKANSAATSDLRMGII